MSRVRLAQVWTSGRRDEGGSETSGFAKLALNK
jgi:hypothetical protein